MRISLSTIGLTGLRRSLNGVLADFTVTSLAGFNAVLANSAAALSGKVIEIAAPIDDELIIDGKAMTSDLVIRSKTAADKVRGLRFKGTTSKVDVNGLHLQMSGWPKAANQLVHFDTGTYSGIKIRNSTFRHGYGPSLVDVDRTANYPEYDRVDNVQTATTTSQTFALTYKDAAATDAWVEFFNRGGQTVHVKYGGAGVTATTADPAVAPGARLRSDSHNPQVNTHVAIIAASGTSEINARTEIGLAHYQAAAFTSSGAANVQDIEIIGNTFSGLSSGIKAIAPPSVRGVVMDNVLRGIYMDTIAMTPQPGGSVHVYRNLFEVPYARSGIAENLTGDARDPHGDLFQMFSDGTGTIENVFSAGNRSLFPATRTGVSAQGLFWSDNDTDPSYRYVFSVSDLLIGGSSNGFSTGEAGFPADAWYLYGSTILDGRNAAASSAINTLTKSTGHGFVGGTLAAGWNTDAARVMVNTVNLLTETPASVLPSFANVGAATDRAGIEAALTTAGNAAGVGAVAHSDKLDWITPDYASVIQWDLLPSGVAWPAQTGLAVSTLVTLPAKRILNRKTGQTVSVSAGTEWQKLGTDGVTVLTAWGAASGSIEPGQYIQLRGTTSANADTTTSLSATINGQAVTTSLKTAIPATIRKAAGTDAYLTGPVLPAATKAFTFHTTVKTDQGPLFREIFEYISTTIQIAIDTRAGKGDVRINIEDANGAAAVLNGTAPGVWTNGVAKSLVFTGTLDDGAGSGHAKVFIEGTQVFSTSFAVPAAPTFATSRTLEILRETDQGYTIGRTRFWTTYSPTGSLPGTTPLWDIPDTLSVWNGTGLPAGFAKAGTGSFT